MLIKSIEIKNFKVFQSVEIKDIPRFVVIVGANGTGKSTLFNVFAFLKEALKTNVTSAIKKWGGFHEVVTRGHDLENIEITLQFVTMINNRERLVTYFLSIVNRDKNVSVEREYIRYKRGRFGSPYHYFDFSFGKGNAILNEEDFDKEEAELRKEDYVLDAPDILAIKGLGQFKRFKAANELRHLIENWHLSDFHISAAREIQEDGYAEHLSAAGENLSQFANYMQESHSEVFAKVLETMKQRVPGVTKIDVERTAYGRLLMRFQDGEFFQDPFLARWVSDGTIKMFAYLLLLNDPSPHPLLCVEEPENQLYPSLLEQLAEEFRDYCEKPPKAQARGQVFVTTHSPDFLNAVPFESIFWLEKNQGVTVIKRAQDHELLRNLIEAGDLPGYLWKQGLFDNVDPRG